MSFEDKDTLFIKAILSNNYIKAESILCECDDRRSVLISALNEMGEKKVQSVVKRFKSAGLKMLFFKLMEDYEELSKKRFATNKEANKIVYVNHENKLNNEKYHLTGSSFANTRKASISA